jgi:hypothetical protein
MIRENEVRIKSEHHEISEDDVHTVCDPWETHDINGGHLRNGVWSGEGDLHD